MDLLEWSTGRGKRAFFVVIASIIRKNLRLLCRDIDILDQCWLGISFIELLLFSLIILGLNLHFVEFLLKQDRSDCLRFVLLSVIEWLNHFSFE